MAQYVAYTYEQQIAKVRELMKQGYSNAAAGYAVRGPTAAEREQYESGADYQAGPGPEALPGTPMGTMPAGEPDYQVDPNESVANVNGKDWVAQMFGDSVTQTGSLPYGPGVSWQVGSGTTAAGTPYNPGATTQSSATGGGGPGGGPGGRGSSVSDGASGVYSTGAAGMGGVDSERVIARLDNMFSTITQRAQQRADAAMANFRGDPASQAARTYMTDAFTQGITQSMADEYSGRIRAAQAARGLAFGGAPAQAEATMLLNMAEQRRQALLPTMLKDTLDVSMLPAQLENAYTTNYANAGKAAATDASIFLDALKAGKGSYGGSSFNALNYRSLFG